MNARHIFLLVAISLISMPAIAEFADSANPNDDDIFLGPARNNPNPINFNQNQNAGARSAMEGTTAEATTSTSQGEGAMINVDSSQDLSQYGPIDPATEKFILEFDECVKTVGAKYCQAAAQNVMAKRQQESQQQYAQKIAQAQQAALSGDPTAIDFLKQLLAQKQQTQPSTLPFQLPQ